MIDLGTFLIIVVIAIVLFFFMRGIFSFKNGVQLTIRPFHEWMILAKSESKKGLEVMCHTALLEVGSLLERGNLIPQKDFKNLYSNSRVYASDFVMLVIITTDILEKSSISNTNDFVLNEADSAKKYLYTCLCKLYFEGFHYGDNFYKGTNAFVALAHFASDKEQESWK